MGLAGALLRPAEVYFRELLISEITPFNVLVYSLDWSHTVLNEDSHHVKQSGQN